MTQDGLIHKESCLFEKGHIDHLTMTNFVLRKGTHFHEKSEFTDPLSFNRVRRSYFHEILVLVINITLIRLLLSYKNLSC